MTVEPMPGDEPLATSLETNPFIEATTAGIEELLDVYARALGSLIRVPAPDDCCYPQGAADEAAALRFALDEATRQLAALPLEEVRDLETAIEVFRIACAVVHRVDSAVVHVERRWESSAVNRLIEPGVLLASGGYPPILADVVPEPSIPPDQVAEWLRQLHRVLSDFLNGITNTNGTPERAQAIARARELLETLRRYIAAVLGGGAMTLRELFAFLRPFLRQILTVLRPLVGANEWRALGQAIVRVITPMAEYLGGTAGGLPYLWIVLACLAAAGLGALIGWLIGQIKIGDQTIHDHLADFFYWLFWSAPASCTATWQAYLQAKQRRRDYEASGTTLDKDVMVPLLTQEIAFLSSYVKTCAPGQRPFEQELERLQAKLQPLLH